MKTNKRFKLLETTLRDGSYAINYQFNASETRYIAKILDEIGFEYIEVGPGTGFNAKPLAAHPQPSKDEEYIQAAREVVKNAKIGMFFIPGQARESDIDMAVANGLDLIRVGTNIDSYQKGFKYLDLCKKNGIETASNLMKSYAVTAGDFARIANECYNAGADTVYLVDSAGGMLPEDVESFITKTKNLNPNIKLGFHGHDNLGLAITNSITAINAGVEIIDSSIRGMGRSSGNTNTEKLIFVLRRMGFDLPYDINKLLSLSDNVILQYLTGKPEKSLDLIYGFSQFHSSFLGVIDKYSQIHSIDPKELIIEYTKIDKLNIDEALANSLAESISKSTKPIYHYRIEKTVVKRSTNKEQLHALCKELVEQRHKFNKKVFINISKAYGGGTTKVSPVLHSYDNISFASAEVRSKEELFQIVNESTSYVDGFLIDTRIGVDELNQSKNEFYYNDAEIFAKSINNYLSIIKQESKNSFNRIFLEERDEILHNFIKLYKARYDIIDNIKDADIAVIGSGKYTKETFQQASSLNWVIVTGLKSIDSDVSSACKNINFIRIDIEREIFTEIIERLSYSNLINKYYGKKEIDGTVFCSGGFIGPKGAIVVDNINNINNKYGVSNGDGSITYF